MTDHLDLLPIARQAVAIATHLLETGPPGAVHTKGDRDLVTDLDICIQDRVREFLERETPDIEFLGEEGEPAHQATGAKLRWILDPIDGTSNFAHGIPLCATQLALADGGIPIVAVVAAPALRLNYEAVRGRGAYSDSKRIGVGTQTDLGRCIVSVGDYATGPEAEKKNRQRITSTRLLAASVERIRMFGSAALDLAFVAEGRTDACVILANKPWDTAAGTLIASEAGAVITDLSGRPHGRHSGETIAANPRISAEVVRIHAEMQAPTPPSV